MFKWIFTAVFVIFAGIRLRYGKTDELSLFSRPQMNLVPITDSESNGTEPIITFSDINLEKGS